jgi:glycosyltransferase 2 family protein
MVSRDRGAERPPLLERVGSFGARVDLPGPERRGARIAVQIGIGVLIVGFLLGFIASQVGKVPDYDWRFSPGWLALAAGATVACLVMQGEIWRLILRSLGADLDVRPSQAIYASSQLARYVPSNMLMVIGRIVMANRHGVTRRVCLASMVYEAGLTLSAAVVAASYFVITLPALQGVPVRYGILASVPLVLVALSPRVFLPLANYSLRKLGREGLPDALSFPQVLRFTLLYFLDLAVIGLALYAFVSALYPIDAGDFTPIAASYAVSFCVGVLTFVMPGALGTRDATLAVALTPFLPFTVAAAIAVGFRLLQTAAEVAYFGGAVAGDAATRQSVSPRAA